MHAFHLDKLLAGPNWHTHHYLEFLNVPSLSMGLYCLPAGATDPQQPHTEDEVYYIISGQAQFQLENETQPVGPGTLLYVAAHQPHKFHDITEALTLLVFFAPAEHSQK